MSLSGDSRLDRRKQMLRDASLNASSSDESRARTTREKSVEPEGGRGRRNPGYSQDVRHACGVRLVQLIPVRMLSFSAVVGVFVCISSVLLAAHYMIYVSGSLSWYGHPLAVSLDATHPQSIASWFGSHLWLLCLGATILTFQLRRHKLDDYKGEYRLWFWLVITCVLASIDSTTHLSELLGYSLDPWTKAHLGSTWSGKSVVHATMAVLVGVLGVRLCAELKSVPLSLICWLTGLVAWAGSAALAQENLKVDISLQMRYWLRATFWLGGLTAIWIASLAYLRHVYIEAQRRFLARAKLARRNNANDNGRIRDKIAGKLSPKTLWGAMPSMRRRASEAEDQSQNSTSKRRARPASTATATSPQTPVAVQAKDRNPTSVAEGAEADSAAKKRHWFYSLWSRRNDTLDDDAPEYQKVQRTRADNVSPGLRSRTTADVSQNPQSDQSDQSDRAIRRQEREALRQEKLAQKQTQKAEREAARQAKQAARKATKESDGNKRFFLLAPLAAIGSMFGKLKLPSFSGLKLQPPEANDAPGESSAKSQSTNQSVQGLRPISSNKPMPGVNRPQASSNYDDDDDDDESNRHLSRAERKRLRRQGRAA